MHDATEFDRRIAVLDCSLLDLVESQSTEKDRRSWLALQRAVRDAKDAYVYLEIGSYLGGSLQQYLQDPKCRRVYSIDKRATDAKHRDNSAQTMLDNLVPVAGPEIQKLVCFAVDAREVPQASITESPDICFIDGGHDYEAVRSDFAFCLRICATDAVIYFHDAGHTRAAIAACVRQLRRSARPFVAHKLPGDTFVVALLESPLLLDRRVTAMARAANGERWLQTAGISAAARRRIPAAIRPALVRVRNRLWGTSHRQA